MAQVFDCRCTFQLEGADPSDLHEAVSEFSRLSDERPEVLGTYFWRQERDEQVQFNLRAVDAADALAMARALVAEIEDAVNRRFGAGSLRSGSIQVLETPDMPQGFLEQLDAMATQEWTDDLLSSIDAAVPPPALGEGYETMRRVGTNGARYGLSTASIEAWFRSLQDRARFRFTEVGPSHVAIEFEELPDDLEEFAEEACLFCPDLGGGAREGHTFEITDGELVQRAAVESVTARLVREKSLHFTWR